MPQVRTFNDAVLHRYKHIPNYNPVKLDFLTWDFFQVKNQHSIDEFFFFFFFDIENLANFNKKLEKLVEFIYKTKIFPISSLQNVKKHWHRYKPLALCKDTKLEWGLTYLVLVSCKALFSNWWLHSATPKEQPSQFSRAIPYTMHRT